jgi:RimJ/RimL family protein N-acetyltransferase
MTEALKIQNVTLQGNLVRLEPYTSAELEELARAALSAPEIFRYIPVRMDTVEGLRARFDMAEKMMRAGTALFFLTRSAKTGELLGSTAFMVTDAGHRRLEIGFTWLLPKAQKTRANTEAKLLQLTHAFETLGAVRVEFKTDSRNELSRSALLRLGATQEGILRSHMICWDGHRRDSVYFSIIDTEWPAVKARLEAKLANAV